MQPGDYVDLERDLFADSIDPAATDHPEWESEYEIVAEVERESLGCIRVDFESGFSCGFPLYHQVTVGEYSSVTVPCAPTPKTTESPFGNGESKPRPHYVECGCCGGVHKTEFVGDCRDDSNRFTFDELDAKHGENGYTWDSVEDQMEREESQL